MALRQLLISELKREKSAEKKMINIIPKHFSSEKPIALLLPKLIKSCLSVSRRLRFARACAAKISIDCLASGFFPQIRLIKSNFSSFAFSISFASSERNQSFFYGCLASPSQHGEATNV